MRRMLSFILTPIYFIIFGLILVILHPIQILAHWLFGIKGIHAIVSLMIFFQIKTLLLIGTRVKYINFKPAPKDKPVLFIGNHQSMYDMPPLMWYFRKKNIRFIAKKELAKYIPTVSYNLNHGHAITIDRKKGEEALSKIAEEAVHVGEENAGIAIFPEGTRSRDGKVKKFKIGGISKIIEVVPNIIVIPIAIKNTRKMENPGQFGLGIGVTIEVTMLEPRSIQHDEIVTEIKKIEEEIKEIVES